MAAELPSSLEPRVDVLDLMVQLLSETETAPPTSEFYGRLCEALCQLTSMERALLFLYDDARHRVLAVGAYGLDLADFAAMRVTVEDAPIAVKALREDRVVEVSEDIEQAVPPGYARLLGITTLTCTPLAAGGRWLGVILADRGGGQFKLKDAERHTMWMLGKTAALAASARIATRQHERTRRLAERIDLAREIHTRVVQRLFGVSLALSADRELTAEDRARCAAEMQAALADLRSALQRPLAPPVRDTGTTLRDEIERHARYYAGTFELEPIWEDDGLEIPRELEPLAQSVLAEALRNAAKHAQPTRVRVRVARADGAFVLEVANDGAGEAEGGGGMGLRLAAFEALQHGGVLEFGAPVAGVWRVRLMVPTGET
jgi:signal transduction histidine kinase